MKYLFKFLSFFFIISISISDQDGPIEGLYGLCDRNSVVCSQYLIESNGTFEYYRLSFGALNPTVTGTWIALNDSVIVLSSDYQIKENPILAVEEDTFSGDSAILIIVNLLDEIELATADIIMDNDTARITYSDLKKVIKEKGFTFEKKGRVRKIIVRPMEDEEFEFVPVHEGSDYFRIALRMKPEPSKVINDTLLVKDDGVFIWDPNERTFYTFEKLKKTNKENNLFDQWEKANANDGKVPKSR